MIDLENLSPVWSEIRVDLDFKLVHDLGVTAQISDHGRTLDGLFALFCFATLF